MSVKSINGEWEKSFLSPRAMRSADSRGRARPEEECEVRNVYQRDRDRIIHSKAFRRLKHKTQVFIAPSGDHFRTRLTHTLEVMQIARTIARALRLNEDLTEAIALGHDLGHTPFGHAGERSLSLLDHGFSHNKQSLRVVDILENNGLGLNLTCEVRDGILSHSGEENFPQTLEGQVVRLSDRIAYINHDIDDAIRDNIIKLSDLPQGATSILGITHGKRIDTMVKNTISNSIDSDSIAMSASVALAMNDLRNFLFERVYMREQAMREEAHIREIINGFYHYFISRPTETGQDYTDPDPHRAVCDYISGMTDQYALSLYDRLKTENKI